jgi:hypothetical protein
VAFESVRKLVVVDFGGRSIRLGPRRFARLEPLEVWETAGGTLLKPMSVVSKVPNLTLYFTVQVAAPECYEAAPGLVSLARGEESYVPKAADAVGIGTALLAGFAYVAETSWPQQRLLGVGWQGLADAAMSAGSRGCWVRRRRRWFLSWSSRAGSSRALARI